MITIKLNHKLGTHYVEFPFDGTNLSQECAEEFLYDWDCTKSDNDIVGFVRLGKTDHKDNVMWVRCEHNYMIVHFPMNNYLSKECIEYIQEQLKEYFIKNSENDMYIAIYLEPNKDTTYQPKLYCYFYAAEEE